MNLKSQKKFKFSMRRSNLGVGTEVSKSEVPKKFLISKGSREEGGGGGEVSKSEVPKKFLISKGSREEGGGGGR